jgi:hypothetical protein
LRGRIVPLRSRAGKAESPSGRFGVSARRAEGDLEQVDDLGVEGPPVGAGPFGKTFVEVGGQAEGDALLVIHDPSVVAWRLSVSGTVTS